MRRARGFTLVELMFVVAMCMFLMLLTSMIFMTATHTVQNQLSSRQKLAHLDGMVEKMRSDVWQAQSIHLVNDHTLQLQYTDQRIQWTTDSKSKQIIRMVLDSPDTSPHQRYYPAGLAILQFTGFPDVGRSEKLPGVDLPAFRVPGVDLEVLTQGQRDAVVMRLLSRRQLLEAQHAP
ncbi:type II secretion system protein [bacterium AH-315-I18]|nr:type II secretion system protein [bacterium AH-315-I18]